MTHTKALAAIPLLLVCFACHAPGAQQGNASGGATDAQRSQISELFRRQGEIRSFWQTALSPDGRQLAWAVEKAGGSGEEVYVANLEQPAQARRVTANAKAQSCWEHDPVWANDSKQLAFLSDCATPGQAQLFVEDLSQSSPQPRQLTHLKGFLSQPQWSPNNRRVGLLFVDHASRAPSPMAAENKAVGVIDDLQNTDVQRLALTDVDTGVTTELTPAGLYVFEYDWSPDGDKFVFTAAPPPGDDNWYIAKLYVQPVSTQLPREIYQPHFQIALPRWSPDAGSIGFIEGLMSDQGGTGGEIYILPSSGGQPHSLTTGRPSTPSWFTWLSNSEMLFTEFDGGSVAINQLDIKSQNSVTLWKGGESIRAGPEETSLAVSQMDGSLKCALIRSSWSMLPEVWVGPVGHWRQVTSANRAVSLPLPRSANVLWNNEGHQIQGWLLYPVHYDRQKRYPLLVAIHGGPAWIAKPEWRTSDFNTTLFTQFDYFVFFPNARGSYGKGEAFTQANRRDWGFGDLRDTIAGVDAIEKTYPVDDQRVGILGWSYGGSTAMMAVTQTNRFHAAVAGAGAADWQSYYGQNSIDKWMIPYFGASVYDDPQAYARCSAMTYIKNTKTPTLVLVGEYDGEAPPAQSQEFWHALKELNVPTRLVIYAGEGHSFSKASDQIDVTVRTLNWFDRYLGGNSSASKTTLP